MIGRFESLVRRLLFGALTVGTTAAGCVVLGMILSAGGFVVMEVLLLALFAVLFLWISASFWMAFLGFCICLRGNIRVMPRPAAPASARPHDLAARTAIIMPIYNEDVPRVFAGVRAVLESLGSDAPKLPFDFYVLSDSTDPGIWVEEELAWGALCRELNGKDNLFYRHRARNTHQKCGNIVDFCRRAGQRYDYMVILDADSLMAGGTIAELVRRMDANPEVGLIQTPPQPVGGETLFARLQQFSASVYGPVFAAGAAFWHLGEGNYWGHNAILRLAAFMQHCGLPSLPGRRPLGGEILSHDFVEAALLRRGGWSVWLAPDLTESFEAPPETVAAYAKRDQRWCQGNLQHLRVLFARGLHPMSRLHLAMGAMSFLSSPLWLLLLAGSILEVLRQNLATHDYFIGRSLFPSWPVYYVQETLTLLGVTLALLYLPKLFGVLVLARRPGGMAAHGGVAAVMVSSLVESVLSALIAPVMMALHTRFVVNALRGRDVGWAPQDRSSHSPRTGSLIVLHGGHTLAALAIGGLVYHYLPVFFWWLTPVLVGPVLSIPLDLLLSSSGAGRLARRHGLLLVPSETAPVPVIGAFGRALHEMRTLFETATARGTKPVAWAVTDPIVNALHLMLLDPQVRRRSERLRLDGLVFKAHEEGIEFLPEAEQKDLLSDRDSMIHLHALSWAQLAGPDMAPAAAIDAR